jgi:GDP-4-dehydro-6-deoxy-D-mannose reductase
MNVLVTGANGFVGRHLLPLLRHEFPQNTIVASSRDACDGYVQMDVSKSEQVDRVIAALRPAACIHLAAVSSVAEVAKAPQQGWDVNFGGTLNVANALQRHAPHCLLVFISTSEVYGGSFRSHAVIDEDAPLAPRNLYAATKAAADVALAAYAAAGLRVIRVRPFNHTGPGQPAGFVVPDFARQVALISTRQQAPVIRTGTLSVERDFLDVRDVCAAYVACLKLPSFPDGCESLVLNVGSGQVHVIGDILRDLLAMARVDAEIMQQTGLRRPGEITRAGADVSRIRNVLGWKPMITWHDTLNDVLRDWKQRVSQPAS